MDKSQTITLLDGRTLTCYENNNSEQPVSNTLKLDTTGTYFRVGRHGASQSTKHDEKKDSNGGAAVISRSQLFLTYFQTFYAHRERILSDSRMFLACIPMRNGLAYTGTSGFECPTLGVLIEWLLNVPEATEQDEQGRVWMVCGISGSPLSGSNRCTLVDGEGNTLCKQVSSFLSLWSNFMQINTRYDEAKTKYQHYTLEEVLAIFNEEGLLTLDQKEITILHLNNQIACLKKQLVNNEKYYKRREDRFHNALMKRHFVQMRDMVAELDQQLADNEKRLQQIYAIRADLRKQFKSGELLQHDFQTQMSPLNRERINLVDFLRKKPTSKICDTLFYGEDISYTEMKQFLVNAPQTERNNQLTNLLGGVKSYIIRH